MYIEHLELHGFSGLPEAQISLERFSCLGGSPRSRVAIADAIHLGLAILDESLFRELLERWGCRGVRIEKDGTLPGSATWDSAPGLAAMLAQPQEGLLKCQLTIALDPPLFGKLRAKAVRDVALVDAIGGGARLLLGVGLRFSPSFDAVSLDLLRVEVGGTSFPIAGSDRPEWLLPFLSSIGRRLQRGPAPERWGLAARSWEARQQHALKRATEAIARAPFRLGDLRVLPEGIGKLETEALLPLRQLGPEAERAVGMVGAVQLSGSDLLLWEEPLPASWRPWLSKQAEAENSPLEQVILLGPQTRPGWLAPATSLPIPRRVRTVRVLTGKTSA